MKSSPSLQSNLARLLAKHQAEILQQWLWEVGADVKFYPFQTRLHIREILFAYLDEIASFLEGKQIRVPQLPRMQMPFDSVQTEIHVLLVGEGVVAQILRRHFKEIPKHWSRFRREIRQLFHETLRTNAAMACDQCRWELNGGLSKAQAFEKHSCDLNKK